MPAESWGECMPEECGERVGRWRVGRSVCRRRVEWRERRPEEGYKKRALVIESPIPACDRVNSL